MSKQSSQFITVHNVHLSTMGIVGAGILPHRGDALNIIDGVIDFRLEPESCLTTMKNFCKDDPVFAGHFPGRPVCPGHWLLENACLTVALFHFCLTPIKIEQHRKKPMLFQADNLTWRAQVMPHDVIFSRAYNPQIRSRAFDCAVRITNLRNEVVFEAKKIGGLLA
jgi:3-hydroxymyristoyl/3-hydroxydecanoyl-(acyl carrier protein) dehydratase